MAGIKSFFRKLFGRDDSDDVICRKQGDEYYAYRKVQGNYTRIAGPFPSCEICKTQSGASVCRES